MNKTKELRVLSLFDGMACGMLAFQKAGATVSDYYAYENDKYATKTVEHNFPEIKECGDVFDTDFSKYVDIDYIVGGSPCTYWSICQKKNRETEASGEGWELFSQYVKAVKTVKPKFFIYENNKSMSKAIKQSVIETFGFEPICINSALVSAQKRQRLYWVGKRNEDGTYSKVDVKQPEDRGILLRDIIDAEPINTIDGGKARTVKAQCQQTDINNICRYHSTYSATGVAEPVRVGGFPKSNGEISTSQGMRIYSTKGKSVSITANGGGMGAKTGLYAIPVEFENDKPTRALSPADGKSYHVYEVKDGLVKIKDGEYPIKLPDGYYIIRKLTVNECKKLQTIPDWYEFPVSDSRAYKMIGNGWTVDVIAHLIKATFNS